MLVKSWKHKCSCITMVTGTAGCPLQQWEAGCYPSFSAGVSDRDVSHLRGYQEECMCTHTQTERHVHVCLSVHSSDCKWVGDSPRNVVVTLCTTLFCGRGYTCWHFWSAGQCQQARDAPLFCWQHFSLSRCSCAYNHSKDNSDLGIAPMFFSFLQLIEKSSSQP